jgi:V-type H+-transporting ATPase subunit C
LALPLIPRLTRRRLAADDEFVLQSVTVFKKVKEEFTHKCRENK